MRRILAFAPLLATLLAAPAAALEATPSAELRMRHEHVDDAAFARAAEATTLRARIGLKLQFDPAWSAFAEGELTRHLFGDRFNSTANGNTAFPVAADPDSTELNQSWLRYATDGAGTLTLGRQRLLYDNQRFIGNVGWRQNEQTFDALDWRRQLGAVQVRYSYLDRVQRIFGADHPVPAQRRWDLDTHLLAGTVRSGLATFTGYAHLVDNDTLDASSHRNLGVRAVFAPVEPAGRPWRVVAEYASQRPYADGNARNEADYWLLEVSIDAAGTTLHAGYEVLGGDGRYGFATPFATLHAFNGWADRFGTTPVDGLRDGWIGARRGFGAVSAQLAWHRFEADHGGADYGSEWDAALAWPFAPRWNLLLKLARYDSDGFGADVDKAWVDLEYRY